MKSEEDFKHIKGRPIYCSKCFSFIGKIANGSLLQKNVTYICERCNSKKKSETDFSNIFSMFNKG